MTNVLNEMLEIDLARFPRRSFDRGRGMAVRCLWRLLSPIVASGLIPVSGVRKAVLTLFGALIGRRVILSAGVRVRYPWRLVIGDNTWIGEDCWIDNWSTVTIGSNVCISQGAYICTGNHDWTDPAFAITPAPIVIGDGAWIAARAVIGPGVEVGPGAIAGIGAVITKNVPAWEIHGGNPASLLRMRRLQSSRHCAGFPHTRDHACSQDVPEEQRSNHDT